MHSSVTLQLFRDSVYWHTPILFLFGITKCQVVESYRCLSLGRRTSSAFIFSFFIHACAQSRNNKTPNWCSFHDRHLLRITHSSRRCLGPYQSMWQWLESCLGWLVSGICWRFRRLNKNWPVKMTILVLSRYLFSPIWWAPTMCKALCQAEQEIQRQVILLHQHGIYRLTRSWDKNTD